MKRVSILLAICLLVGPSWAGAGAPDGVYWAETKTHRVKIKVASDRVIGRWAFVKDSPDPKLVDRSPDVVSKFLKVRGTKADEIRTLGKRVIRYTEVDAPSDGPEPESASDERVGGPLLKGESQAQYVERQTRIADRRRAKGGDLTDQEVKDLAKTISAQHAAKASAAARGKKPGKNPFTGSYYAINDFLSKYLHDYDSAEYLDSMGPAWSEGDGAWLVVLRYRAKNRIGAYVLSIEGFLIRNDVVVKHVPQDQLDPYLRAMQK